MQYNSCTVIIVYEGRGDVLMHIDFKLRSSDVMSKFSTQSLNWDGEKLITTKDHTFTCWEDIIEGGLQSVIISFACHSDYNKHQRKVYMWANS